MNEQNTTMVYYGGSYWIEQDAQGRAIFNDNNTRCVLAKMPNDPTYIKYDENEGWIYKNGKPLPWTE